MQVLAPRILAREAGNNNLLIQMCQVLIPRSRVRRTDFIVADSKDPSAVALPVRSGIAQPLWQG